MVPTEDALERWVLEILQELGWTPVHGPDIAPGEFIRAGQEPDAGARSVVANFAGGGQLRQRLVDPELSRLVLVGREACAAAVIEPSVVRPTRAPSTSNKPPPLEPPEIAAEV